MNQTGFSLFDLLVALAILASGLAAGGLFAGSAVNQRRIRLTGEALVGRLQQEALIARTARMPVCIATNGSSVLYNRGCEHSKTPLAAPLPKGFSAVFNFAHSANTKPDILVYRAQGTATPGTVRLNYRSAACTITQPLRDLPRLTCP